MRRQHPCDSCARVGKVQVSQYRCPACLRCSCSLACVKDHKLHYSCSGVRDKAAPVPKRLYDEHNLISDYALLEEAKRAKDQASHNRVKNFYNPRAPTPVHDPIPKHKQRIMGREAAKRGIDLRFMPNMFYRHRVNTSHVKPVDYSKAQQHNGVASFDGFERRFDKIMVWRVDVQFSGTDGGTRLVEVRDLDEEANMNHVLERAVKSLHIRNEPRLNGAVDPYLHYSGLSGNQLNAYIKNEISLGARRAQPTSLPDFPKYKRRKIVDGRVSLGHLELDTRGFILVDTDKTLRESLYSALVVEYPILYIAPKGSEEDKQLQQATKSLFDKPELEADDSVRPPTTLVPPDDSQENGISQEKVQMREAHIAASNVNTDSLPASAVPNGNQQEAQFVEKSIVMDRDDSKIGKNASAIPSSDEKAALESLPRGVKRKATTESSDDDESDLSELERNITKRFTPHRKNGGKTGWTRDGKVRTADEEKPAPLPVPIPKFRSVLPPIHYDKHDRVDMDKEKESSRRDGSSPAVSDPEDSESESHKEKYSGEGSNEIESSKPYAGTDIVEQWDEKEVVGQKRSVKKLAQERRRPAKRQRFEDLETIEVKKESKPDDLESDQSDDEDEDGEKPKSRQLSDVESPTLPFLKVDSVLLDTRIPRRKKIADPNGRETLAC